MICAFSGHRPQRLPWGTAEEDPRCVALKIKLEQEIGALIDSGTDIFLCGLARGCDTYFAEAVLHLKQGQPQVQLCGVLPCHSQSDRWPEADRIRYDKLCESCARVILLQGQYTKGCMLRRNQWMTEHADMLMTVYDGGPGGTGWTVHAANQREMPVIALWL